MATTKDSTTAPKETAAARFTRLANKRGGSVIDSLGILAKLGNGRHEYTPAQVDNLFAHIRKAVDDAEKQFKQPTTKKDREVPNLVG